MGADQGCWEWKSIMLELIKTALYQFINDIDSGNSNINEKQQMKLLDLLSEINSQELSKLESADYIGVCRATFDNYVNKGLIPKGKKKQGYPLLWNKSDLDKFLENENIRK